MRVACVKAMREGTRGSGPRRAASCASASQAWVLLSERLAHPRGALAHAEESAAIKAHRRHALGRSRVGACRRSAGARGARKLPYDMLAYAIWTFTLMFGVSSIKFILLHHKLPLATCNSTLFVFYVLAFVTLDH